MAISLDYTTTSLARDSKVIYSTQIESRVWQALKGALECTLCIYHTIAHFLVSIAVCPQATILSVFRDISSIEVPHSESLSAERKTIEVDGNEVDVIVMKQKKHPHSHRWNIVAGGNGEGILATSRHYDLTAQLGGNTIYFDYAGLRTRAKLIKAARAVMRYVESQGAKDITAIGASLGGSILREAYSLHHDDKAKAFDSRYAFIGDRTFSTIFDVISTMMPRIFAYLVHFLGWNLGSAVTNKFEFELAIQDEHDRVIRRDAWLSDRGIITQGHGHITPVVEQYPNIINRINQFFLLKKAA